MKNLITTIIKSQKENGSFYNEKNKSDLLISSLILIELKKLTTSCEITLVKNKLTNWIIKQKNKNCLFDKNLMINFIATSAVINLIDGQDLSNVLNILIKNESAEGGPYYSSTNKKDKNIDLGVNVAIAYFLSSNKVELPKLNNLIEAAINKEEFFSKFCNKTLVIYLISKFYNGLKKQTLIDYLLEKLNNLKGSEKIIALGALNNLGVFLNFSILNSTSALETVIFLSSTSKIKPDTIISNQENLILKNILNEANNRFKNLSPELRRIALQEIHKTLSTNKDKQMSLIAYYFKVALGTRGQIINDDLVVKAGLANIFFWTAFIIYDDFWDEDEQAIPSILPCANLYARHYINFYDNVLPEITGFKFFFHNLMDKLDAANTWETLSCRTKVIHSKFIIPKKLPDYNKYEYKFQPASGQILGPLIFLIKCGFKLDSKETGYLIDYFRNYLISMQLNDDTHDWIEDMGRGHLSTVVVMLIKDWQKKYPDKLEIDLVVDLEKLQQLFWLKTIKLAAQTSIFFTKQSRKALELLTFLENPAPLINLINITENVAKEALNKQQESLSIIKNFK